MEFLGCPKTLAGKRQNFTEKIPRKIHHAWGPSGEGLGRTEKVAIPVDLDQNS